MIAISWIPSSAMVSPFAVNSSSNGQTARTAGAFLFSRIRPRGGRDVGVVDALGAEPLLAALAPAFAVVAMVPEERADRLAAEGAEAGTLVAHGVAVTFSDSGAPLTNSDDT
jgi:hypothetical protein